MNLNEILKRRYSCRSYTNKNINDDKINEMLNNAILAPNAGNLQSWRFVVVKDENKREEIALACMQQKWMTQAPLHIVVLGDMGHLKKYYGNRAELYAIQDSALAAGNILITAASLDIDSCFISAFDEDMLKRCLNVPENIKPFVVLTLGYSNEKPEEKKRHHLSSLTFFESYGNSKQDKSIFPVKNKSKSFFNKLIKHAK